MNQQTVFYRASGKRKTSIAKVQLEKGSGAIVINKKTFDSYFSGLLDERDKIKTPFVLANMNNEYNIHAQVSGGGISSQLDAICLAVAKALCLVKAEYRNIFNKNLLLRRDSRIKERRKYGLKKARKASQYSKR